jgi:hypothetical protein
VIVATDAQAQVLTVMIWTTPLDRHAIVELRDAVNDVTRNDAAEIIRWLWTIQ